MFAVALYSAPLMIDTLPVVQYLHEQFDDSVDFYLFTTSQWQSWPLFAPDPRRKVSEILVDEKQDDTWVTIPETRRENIAWWRKSKETKIAERLKLNGREELRKRYLSLQCDRLNIPDNTIIRLKNSYYTVPKHSIQKSSHWWKNWKPTWQQKVFTKYECSHAS